MKRFDRKFHTGLTDPLLQLWATRKPVFLVFDQVRLKPACATTEASWSLESLVLASIFIILSRQRKTKALIRLRGCAGWSAPLLFAYDINTFSHEFAHILLQCKINAMLNNNIFAMIVMYTSKKKVNRKVNGLPQSQATANPWHQEEEKKDKK